MAIELQHLSLQHCRIVEQAELILGPGMNMLIGPNGSGKSSVLEALSILARGRSFRTTRTQEVISYGASGLSVIGRIHEWPADISYPLGIHKQRNGETRIRINHADMQQQSELSRYLPLTLIHADSLDLLTGPPAQRRALLDWVAFYREAGFHSLWKTYQRTLKQRNACLRDANQRYALGYWTNEFIALQAPLYQFRLQAVLAIQTALESFARLFEGIGNISLQLSKGLPASLNLQDSAAVADFWQQRQEQELRYGTTLFGVHRSDLAVYLNDELAAKIASRGQLKLLSIALLLAQSEAITNENAKRGIIAIDDLAAELDSDNQQRLYSILIGIKKQLIITGTRQPPANFLPTDTQLFHVEQGRVAMATH